MIKSFGCALVILVLLGATAWRTDTSSLPRPAVEAGSEYVAPQTCAECHPGIYERFQSAPHSYTLRRAEDPSVMKEFAGRSIEVAGRTFAYDEVDGELWLSSGELPYRRRVDWIFGSGRHELTPVSIGCDVDGQIRLSQLHISRFNKGQLGITPGSEELDSKVPTLGLPHSVDETRRCFNCHTSHVPEDDGRLELDHLVAGIWCSRCHAGAAEHVAREGELLPSPDWNELTALESINRCGECHRRVDEFTPDELTPDQKHLARFAPVGMALSRCFKANDPGRSAGTGSRFDCMTCHDPHAPARTDAAFYNDRCRDCHGDEPNAAHATAATAADHPGPCPVQPSDASCIDCHMPKVELVEHLEFTDHWIRTPEGD